MSLDGFDDIGDDFDIVHSTGEPLCITVNQTGTRIGVGHTRGFVVYSVHYPTADSDSREQSPQSTSMSGKDPSSSGSLSASGPQLREEFQHTTLGAGESGQGGIGIMALLYQTNTVAVCGGGKFPLRPLNRVCFFSGTAARSEIRAPDVVRDVQLCTGQCIILSQTQFLIANFAGEVLMSTPASGGVLSSPSPGLAIGITAGTTNTTICAFPSSTTGHVSIVDVDTKTITTTFKAHNNAVTALAIDVKATTVATASEKGTLLRIWNVNDTSSGPRSEVRNASYGDAIRRLGVSGSDHVFCLSGPTVKVFYVGKDGDRPKERYEVAMQNPNDTLAKNQQSSFAMLGSVSSFFSSQWACSEAQIPERLVATWADPPPALTSTVASSVAGLFSSFSGGSAEKTSPSASSNPVAVDHYEPSGLSDFVIGWWEQPAALGLVQGTPRPGAGTHHLLCATVEGGLVRFAFNAHNGTTGVTSVMHAPKTKEADRAKEDSDPEFY